MITPARTSVLSKGEWGREHGEWPGAATVPEGGVPEGTRAEILLRDACRSLRAEHPWSGSSKCRGPGAGVCLVHLERRKAGWEGREDSEEEKSWCRC